jgi:hypothetical protein
MLFDIFKSGIIPHNRPNINKPTSVLVSHAEIERSEYSYDWNSDGVRSIEFTSKPPIVALGCSITLGQGLPIHLRWSDLLSKKLGLPIGNISYSGGSIAQIISSFFGMIKQYDYKPEYVIANFPPFERFYFVDGNGEKMKDYWLGNKKRKTKDQAPWDYGATIPYEWVYYDNLNHIQMLEVFCKTNGINLIWSTWTNSLSKEQEAFLVDNFDSYVNDTVKKEFPPHFEFYVNPKEVEGLLKFYKMTNWDSIGCHSKEAVEYSDIFDYGYDYHKIGKALDRDVTRTPHPGVHKHIHWAEFYSDIINSMELKNE